MNIAIVGCGDVGTRCARLLCDAGHRVVGARRNIAALPSWITAVEADVLNPASLGFLHADDQPAFDVVIYALAAAGFSEEAYRAAYVVGVKNTLQVLQHRPPRRLLFLSSTGVYHQNDGGVVNEESPTEPVRFNGQLVLQGEALVRQTTFGTCVRFSGIYGPDRLRLINRVASGQATMDPTAPYTNRIHVEDCAGVLAHLVEMAAQEKPLDSIYLASDCEPATSADVELFIAERLGLSLEGSTPVAKSKRIAGSKRCDNTRLINSGYQFKYPDYRAGYAHVIDEMRSQSVGGGSNEQ